MGIVLVAENGREEREIEIQVAILGCARVYHWQLGAPNELCQIGQVKNWADQFATLQVVLTRNFRSGAKRSCDRALCVASRSRSSSSMPISYHSSSRLSTTGPAFFPVGRLCASNGL